MQKMFVLQIKYKSFLNIYSFCKKNVLNLKNIVVKTSLWTQLFLVTKRAEDLEHN